MSFVHECECKCACMCVCMWCPRCVRVCVHVFCASEWLYAHTRSGRCRGVVNGVCPSKVDMLERLQGKGKGAIAIADREGAEGNGRELWLCTQNL